jgi:hypothetical protein
MSLSKPSFSIIALFLYFFVWAMANFLSTSHVFPVLLHGNNCSNPGSSSALVDICQIRVISSPLLNSGLQFEVKQPSKQPAKMRLEEP